MKIIKRIFLFLASIKLAIPVMLSLLVACATGTIYESLYNTEYASLMIYKTWWFLTILGFLFINILFATLTRLPWKRRHLGFLITHLGMLLLLVGSVLTMVFGLDGTMQIMEGGDSNLVFLQNNVLEIDRKLIPIKRFLNKYDIAEDKQINSTEFKFVSYLPFVDVPEKSFDRGININFKIKSPFFDVLQVLNDELEKEVQMGPATFRIVNNEDSPVQYDEVKNTNHALMKDSSDKLIIRSVSGKELAAFNFDKKSNFKYEDISIEIVRKFKNAQIVNNKIGEGDPSGNNPALELKISKGSQQVREIIYQNIPSFTLNSNGVFGFSFAMLSTGSLSLSSEPTSSLPANHPHITGTQTADRSRNTVEFKIVDKEKNLVEVSLYKSNELLDKKILKKDELLITPWMGIELTFKGITNASDVIIPSETFPKRKMPLPPSAILMKHGNSERWIVENSETQISNGMSTSSIYYGRERMVLPFSLYLEKFEKRDYPGSEMAMNYKSFVKINSHGDTKEIYMNEPLKFEGFTFYQSSYQLNPNSPAITILSVNKDPGRVLKYLGSIILCFGIVFYTFQKSKRFSKILN